MPRDIKSSLVDTEDLMLGLSLYPKLLVADRDRQIRERREELEASIIPDEDFYLTKEEIEERRKQEDDGIKGEVTASEEEINKLKHIMSYSYRTIITMGRNDRCFCGSGKKLKQCCLPLQERIKKRNARVK